MASLIPVKLYLTPAQAVRLRNGHVVQLKAEQLIRQTDGTHEITLQLHPTTASHVHKAFRNKHGVRISLSHHEAAQSGSLWDVLKKVGSFLKPVASAALDGIATAGQSTLNSFVPGIGDVIAPGLREGVRDLTGVGINKNGATKSATSSRNGLIKGSQQARDHMARVRAARAESQKKSGSFRL